METVDWRPRKLRFKQTEKNPSKARVSGNRCKVLEKNSFDSWQYKIVCSVESGLRQKGHLSSEGNLYFSSSFFVVIILRTTLKVNCLSLLSFEDFYIFTKQSPQSGSYEKLFFQALAAKGSEASFSMNNFYSGIWLRLLFYLPFDSTLKLKPGQIVTVPFGSTTSDTPVISGSGSGSYASFLYSSFLSPHPFYFFFLVPSFLWFSFSGVIGGKNLPLGPFPSTQIDMDANFARFVFKNPARSITVCLDTRYQPCTALDRSHYMYFPLCSFSPLQSLSTLQLWRSIP